MDITRHQSGPRMSHVVVANGFAFIAGQVADIVEGRDCADQARQVLAKIDTLLAQAGTDKSRLVSVTVYLTNISDFDAFNSVWDAWLPVGCAPARACVESKFVRSDWLVEVVPMACL